MIINCEVINLNLGPFLSSEELAQIHAFAAKTRTTPELPGRGPQKKVRIRVFVRTADLGADAAIFGIIFFRHFLGGL